MRIGCRGGHPCNVTDEAGKLAGDLVHVPYRSFADHLATIEQYTTIMARGCRWLLAAVYELI